MSMEINWLQLLARAIIPSFVISVRKAMPMSVRLGQSVDNIVSPLSVISQLSMLIEVSLVEQLIATACKPASPTSVHPKLIDWS